MAPTVVFIYFFERCCIWIIDREIDMGTYHIYWYGLTSMRPGRFLICAPLRNVQMGGTILSYFWGVNRLWMRGTQNKYNLERMFCHFCTLAAFMALRNRRLFPKFGNPKWAFEASRCAHLATLQGCANLQDGILLIFHTFLLSAGEKAFLSAISRPNNWQHRSPNSLFRHFSSLGMWLRPRQVEAKREPSRGESHDLDPFEHVISNRAFWCEEWQCNFD